VSNGHMTSRLRIVLPMVLGVLTFILTAWDVHNWRVIESMGIAWDIGAPIWPYQTSDILLRLLNLPAYFASMPLANLLRLHAPQHHLIVFPAVLVWWWFLGKTLDHRRAQSPPRVGWLAFSTRSVFIAILLWVTISASAHAYHWWIHYGDGAFSIRMLIMLRLLTPAVWCCALVALSALVWRRSVGSVVANKKSPSRR